MSRRWRSDSLLNSGISLVLRLVTFIYLSKDLMMLTNAHAYYGGVCTKMLFAYCLMLHLIILCWNQLIFQSNRCIFGASEFHSKVFALHDFFSFITFCTQLM